MEVRLITGDYGCKSVTMVTFFADGVLIYEF